MDVKISSDALKIVSLNVRGVVSNFKKRRTIFTWCRKKNDGGPCKNYYVCDFFYGKRIQIKQQKESMAM